MSLSRNKTDILRVRAIAEDTVAARVNANNGNANSDAAMIQIRFDARQLACDEEWCVIRTALKTLRKLQPAALVRYTGVIRLLLDHDEWTVVHVAME